MKKQSWISIMMTFKFRDAIDSNGEELTRIIFTLPERLFFSLWKINCGWTPSYDFFFYFFKSFEKRKYTMKILIWAFKKIKKKRLFTTVGEPVLTLWMCDKPKRRRFYGQILKWLIYDISYPITSSNCHKRNKLIT